MSHSSLTKNIVRVFSVCLITAVSFLAQASPSFAVSGTWEVVGSAGFTDGSIGINGDSMAIDAAGDIYVGFYDSDVSKASVMKYDGGSWDYVGQRGFTAGEANLIDIAFDSQGALYVAYVDATRSYKISISKYDGISWQDYTTGVGVSDSINYFSFEIDNSDNLIIAYADNQSNLTVQKYQSGNWSTLMSGGVNCVEIDLDIDRSTNALYVAYRDRDQLYDKVVVQKYENSTWEIVGGGQASSSGGSSPKMEISSQGILFLAYEYNNDGYGDNVYVRQFTGSIWENVGDVNDRGIDPVIALDSADVPHVVYRDYNLPHKLTGKKFSVDSWETLGASDFTTGGAYYSSAVMNANDVLNVFYKDGSLGNKGTVMNYVIPNLPPTLSFTDPDGMLDKADANFEIKWTDEDETGNASIALYYDTDNTGEDGTLIVSGLSEDDPTDAYTWDTSAVTDGDYYIYAILDDGVNAPVTVYSDHAVVVDHSGAPDWEVVGERGFTQGGVNAGSSIAVSSDGTVYFAYANYANNNRLNVKKFNGTSWEFVGSEDFTTNTAVSIDIALSSSGVPHVVYEDYGNNSMTIVRKWNGTSWEMVGGTVSDGLASHNKIVFDSSDVPYVIYRDRSYGDKATVKKFNGTSWETVGVRGFSVGTVGSPTIAFDNNQTLYSAYIDGSTNSKITVQKFNGSSWTLVGIEEFSGEYSESPGLTFDTDNNPYVAYGDGALSTRLVVKKFNGLNWETVGLEGISSGYTYYISMLTDILGNIYVGYKDGTSGPLSVKKWNGIAWELVGSEGFTNAEADRAKLVIGSDRTLYFGFQDHSAQGATVMQFLQPNSPPSITITQPDGVNDTSTGTFNITWTDEDLDNDASIALYYDTDATGQDGTLIVSGISEDDATDSYTWNTSALTSGDYYVYAIISDGVNSDVVNYSSGPVNVSNDTGGGDPPPDPTGSGIFEQGNGGMYYDGNIGIGTGSTLPLGERLMVNGRIKAHELILENTGWADFVFADDYALLTPKELERFIEINGHLPGIPNSEEIDAAGVSIGALQPKLLQKIEELTLYILDLEARIKMLEQE